MKKIIETIIKSKVYLAIAIAILVALVVLVATIGIKLKRNPDRVVSTATLTDAINVEELAGAQFTYNGIAEIYKEGNTKKVDTYVKYYATVKAKVKPTDVKFNIDKDKKVVTATLPKITLKVDLKDDSKDDFTFIKKNDNLELDDILKACTADAENEAKKATQLYDMAKSSIKETLGALMYPLTNSNGYTIEWAE